MASLKLFNFDHLRTEWLFAAIYPLASRELRKPPAYRELNELYHLPKSLKPQKTAISTDRTPSLEVRST
jgi:hypothetical protein